MLVYIIIVLLHFLTTVFAGPGEQVKFTAPAALVAEISSENQTFQGKDTSSYLADFVVVSHHETNGKKSFTMTKKGVGSIDVSCEKDGHCIAVAKKLR